MKSCENSIILRYKVIIQKCGQILCAHKSCFLVLRSQVHTAICTSVFQAYPLNHPVHFDTVLQSY